MSCTLLIEIGTEDLPARYVLPLADALADGVVQGLASRGLGTGNVTRFATPRRLAVMVAAVPTRQPDQQVTRTGPALKAAIKDGQPTPAGLGFAKSCGVDFADLGERDGKLHFEKTEPGAATADLLQAVFDDTLKQMDQLVPKRMRWGSGDDTFVRPVTWLTALLGTDVVPLQAFGLKANRITYGHRFHAPQAIQLDAPEPYADRLFDAKVIADPQTRKTHIAAQISAEAQAAGGHARVTGDLLDEVSALVEWPVAITGHFEQRFLELPPEVIVATVETNQRYFTVFEDPEQTRLTSAFITVINIESRDVAQVITGNERVVRPRLSDAAFFFDQDRAIPLEQHAEGLARVTFQQALGTVADKQARVAALATALARETGASDQRVADVQRAAALCKADLVTKMVFEFPELQGLMGGDYARRNGAPEGVWRAIAEHYLPTQQGTPIPSTPEGQMVALADKLDTLAGIFAIGQKPTASKDPYALRRAALGVLRILIEGGWSLDLQAALKMALDAQPAGDRGAQTLTTLLDFTMERLRAYRVGTEADGRAITPEAFEAVRALGGTRPLDVEQRLLAVHGFTVLPAASALAAANKRIRNVLRQAEEREPGSTAHAVDAQALKHTSEQALWTTITALEKRGAGDDYAARLVDLASLRDPVDDFFDAVMVNDPDAAIRQNRLALLARVDALCREVADLSQLPG